MSRLEDELRLALRREDPSPDFTDRVMERVAVRRAGVAKKAKWWQKFFEMFEPRVIGWAAVGAAILLLIVIGEIQYQKSRSAEMVNDQKQPAREQPQDRDDKQAVVPQEREEKPQRAPRRIAPRPRVKPEEAIASTAEKRAGEEAKRKLMLALEVTSATLNEAQRIVREDRAGRK